MHQPVCDSHKPIKACVLGPPGSGKTHLITPLTKYHKTHHIKTTEVLNEAVTALLEKYSSLPVEDLEALEDDEDKRLYDRLLRVVEDCRERNEEPVYEDILDDSHICRFFREKLRSKPCQNQGFILDGFPKTLDQAKDLFSVEETDEPSPEETEKPAYDVEITPEIVFVLAATDEFLKERILNLPLKRMADSYKTDASFARLLVDYHDSNPEDEPNPICTYFKELEIKVEQIDISKLKQDEGKKSELEAKVKEELGVTRAYDLTSYQKLEEELKDADEAIKLQNEKDVKLSRKEGEERISKELKRQELLEADAEEKKAEADILMPKVLPMRNYLMRSVMPTLIEGLIDCVKHRPENGIDHLAEYIFKHNPQECYTMPEEVEVLEDDLEDIESMEEETVEFFEKDATFASMDKRSTASTPRS